MGGLIKPTELQSSYIVTFPNTDRSNTPIIRDLSDKIEIQFTLDRKPVVLQYKIKDLVNRLADL